MMGSSTAQAAATEAESSTAAEPLLVLRDIDKSFGITQALSEANLEI
ncbi:hypothetical protein SDC9_190351 [bioreactor metagenome]|uniref:Uncharacterized protein n=1 Tax=bioreactor metagenome TaxID=1076179 RepID=A0A645I5Q0_9ZZZZ